MPVALHVRPWHVFARRFRRLLLMSRASLWLNHVGMLVILLLWYTYSWVNLDNMGLGNYREPNQNTADAALGPEASLLGEEPSCCVPDFPAGAIRPAGWVSENIGDE